MDRKRSQTLGTFNLKVKVRTDEDGDIIVDPDVVTDFTMTTENLAYLIQWGIYSNRLESDSLVLEGAKTVFNRRPNRSDYQ